MSRERNRKTQDPLSVKEAREKREAILSDKNTLKQDIQDNTKILTGIKENIAIKQRELSSVIEDIGVREHDLNLFKTMIAALNENKRSIEALIKEAQIKLQQIEDDRIKAIAITESEQQKKADSFAPLISSAQEKLDNLTRDLQVIETNIEKGNVNIEGQEKKLASLQSIATNLESIVIPALSETQKKLTSANLSLAEEKVRQEGLVRSLVQKTQRIGIIEAHLAELEKQEIEAENRLNLLNESYAERYKDVSEKIEFNESLIKAIDKKTEDYKKMTSRARVASTMSEKLES